MKAALIALAGLLVVVGVAAVLLVSGTSEDSPPKPQAAGSGLAASAHTPGGSVATPTLPTSPSIPTESTPPPEGGSDVTKEYTVGGVKVRDHRTGEHKQMDLPPNMHPANGPSLPSELTHDISQQVKNKMIQCASSMPRDIRGDKPKVDGQLQVAIKDHVLSINSIEVQVRDITDATASDALRQCVQQQAASLTAVAKDQADVADYGIGITFAIP
jgi:hypothetical protein